MMMNKIFACLCLLLLMIGSCKDPEPINPDLRSYEDGILIINEGNFTAGNASLTFIGNDGEVVQRVYETANELPLGDVAQSAVTWNGDHYIVVNNSGRIIRVDATMRQQQVIDGLTSPRFMLPVSSSEAFITDLYANSISLYDRTEDAVVEKLPVGSWTEEMVQILNKVYVGEMGASQLLVIDLVSGEISDSIPVGREPNSLVADGQQLWVLCGGSDNEAARLVRVNTVDRTISEEFVFPNPDDRPSNLVLGPDNSLYYLNQGDIFRMDTAATTLPGTAFIAGTDHLFYHLEIDPQSGRFFATDAIDYVQQGLLIEYDPTTGSELNRWKTGVIPGDLLFLD